MKNIYRVKILSAALLLAGLPSFAQIDLSGEWRDLYHEDQPERIGINGKSGGPDLGDYLALPINAAARMKADSWDQSVQSEPERQCIPHPADYSLRGPANLKIYSEEDPDTRKIVDWVVYGTFGRATRTIWMDGRPHPSDIAPHTWAGFTTGTWEGDTLTTYTTHIKMGYIRRNGVPLSDRATMTEHFMRHGNLLTAATIVEDPVYLTEPYIRTTNWVLNPAQEVGPVECIPEIEIFRPKGSVPHHLPGKNPYLNEFSQMYGIPEVAVRGGAETMYPEYRKTLVGKYKAPAECNRYCGVLGKQ